MLKLARYGGLSHIKQKHFTTNEEEMGYHGAPERKGFYAFLYPYIEWFLLGGTEKIKDIENPKNKRQILVHKYRIFKVNGYVWTHLTIPKEFQAFIVQERGSWVKIHSEYINNILKYNKKEEINKVLPICARVLDNVITLNFYPIKEAEITAKKYRSVGI